MTNSFYSFSVKKEKPANHKESKLNILLNKLTNTFNHHRNFNDLRDYFRNHDKDIKAKIANDSIFEHSKYHQQKARDRYDTTSTYTHTRSSSVHHITHSHHTTSTKHTHPSSIHTTKSGILIHHSHTHHAPSMSESKKSKKSKHKRHYSHLSCISTSNITVNSEDLTAKEFADIAGIKILTEDEIDNELCAHPSTSVNNRKSVRRCVFCDEEDHLDSDLNKQPFIITSCSSIHSTDSQYNEPDIWDHSFWQKPGSEYLPEQDHPFSILHELRNTIHLNSVKSNYPSSHTIKKGRFEITVES